MTALAWLLLAAIIIGDAFIIWVLIYTSRKGNK